ncbi:exocyst complex component 2-like [Hibiscus syriacus]|uniref:Exocyst complex component 2-like n=1 Tax=Hibiscus syriacus TaxID=106335 RepID=A0A6A2XB22_HIBSY|nr:exocyst complex component 2-like [Hibiscus syriacus]
MGKKRKSIATSLDEVDRTMYASFSSAANSLSQLYTQAMNQQKLSFQAGKRHGLEKLYQWICRQQEGGSRVTTMDILSYLQNDNVGWACATASMFAAKIARNELDYGEEPLMLIWPNCWAGTRLDHSDQQSKNLVFSNALSSPVLRSLQHYHIAQDGYCPNGGLPSGNGARNNEPSFLQNRTRDSNPLSSNDTLMDMHADSPSHESTY